MNAIGTYRYSPTLNGSMTRRDGGSTEWWLIIDCEPELGRYLRHMYRTEQWGTREAQSPLWGTHVSVIRGEEPLRKSAWKKFDGSPIEFAFVPQVQETDGYLWVAVMCPLALDHREELGLVRDPIPALHMTIGNLKHEME